MLTIDKKMQKELRRLASELPPIKYQASVENKKILGEDAILSGLKPPEGIEEFNPEEEYLMKIPLIRDVNHYRQLKKQFKKHGHEGVIAYCENIWNH